MTHFSLSFNQKEILKLVNVLLYQSKSHLKTSRILCRPNSNLGNLTEKHASPFHTFMKNEISAPTQTVLQQSSQTSEYEPGLVADPLPISSSQSASSNAAPSFQIHVPTESLLGHKKTTEKNGEHLLNESNQLNYLWTRIEPNTLQRVYYFDTLAFTKKLESKGFSREQSEGCVECLLEVIDNTLDHQAKHMITKNEQKIVEQQLHTEIMSVKQDMVLLQKSEFSALRTETEKLSIDMARIQSHFQDELVKLKGQFTLDVNLERGRALEAHAANEKKLQMLDNKIETGIAHLKTTYEVYRNDIFKYAAGTVLTCTTMIIGFIRLWK